MKNAIEYKHIRMTYGNKTVIPDFSLAIEQGEFVTVIGSSGCGKTTLLKMVNGLISPVSGDILVNGTSVCNADLIALRRGIGYAIQGSVLFPHMTVEQNIAYVLNLQKAERTQAAQAVRKWMELVGLEDSMRKRYPSQLSGGQQQRVGIARALAADPELLLMDEPFGAVDEITRSTLQDEMHRIHKDTGITVLFVTHDINEALKLGTKVLVMDHGELQQYDTPENVKNAPANDFVKLLLARAI